MQGFKGLFWGIRANFADVPEQEILGLISTIEKLRALLCLLNWMAKHLFMNTTDSWDWRFQSGCSWSEGAQGWFVLQHSMSTMATLSAKDEMFELRLWICD